MFSELLFVTMIVVDNYNESSKRLFFVTFSVLFAIFAILIFC